MPNIGSTVLDEEAIQLVSDWIAELTERQSYEAWRLIQFGDAVSPEGEPTFDADGDGDSNYFEFLNGDDPNNPADRFEFATEIVDGELRVSYSRNRNRGYLLEVSRDMSSWEPWDVPGNQLFFGAESAEEFLSIPADEVEGERLFYRWTAQEL